MSKPKSIWEIDRNSFTVEAPKFQRPFFRITMDDFLQKLAECCQNVIYSRKEEDVFEYHPHLRPTVQQLYFHFIGDAANFKGSLNAGVLLQGAKGIGKTSLIEGYIRLMDEMWIRKNFTYINARRFSLAVQERGQAAITEIQGKPIFVDELGQEIKEVLNMGTRINPIPELVNIKYELGSWMFATSNFSINDMGAKAFYGTVISTRISKMMNCIEVPNFLLREENIIKL